MSFAVTTPLRPATGAGKRRWLAPAMARVPIDETAAGTNGIDNEIIHVGNCTDNNLSIAVDTNCLLS